MNSYTITDLIILFIKEKYNAVLDISTIDAKKIEKGFNFKSNANTEIIHHVKYEKEKKLITIILNENSDESEYLEFTIAQTLNKLGLEEVIDSKLDIPLENQIQEQVWNELFLYEVQLAKEKQEFIHHSNQNIQRTSQSFHFIEGIEAFLIVDSSCKPTKNGFIEYLKSKDTLNKEEIIQNFKKGCTDYLGFIKDEVRETGAIIYPTFNLAENKNSALIIENRRNPNFLSMAVNIQKIYKNSFLKKSENNMQLNFIYESIEDFRQINPILKCRSFIPLFKNDISNFITKISKDSMTIIITRNIYNELKANNNSEIPFYFKSIIREISKIKSKNIGLLIPDTSSDLVYYQDAYKLGGSALVKQTLFKDIKTIFNRKKMKIPEYDFIKNLHERNIRIIQNLSQVTISPLDNMVEERILTKKIEKNENDYHGAISPVYYNEQRVTLEKDIEEIRNILETSKTENEINSFYNQLIKILTN